MPSEDSRTTIDAPRHVALVVQFANSLDLDEGTDELLTPQALARWLREHHLVPPHTQATDADLTLARSLRDALRKALLAHHDGVDGSPALDTVAARLPLRLAVDDGAPSLRPVHGGVKGGLEQILAAVAASATDDTWRRMKVCSADTCSWAYFDQSKNRSRTWCEWGCGNKLKTRAYRARRKAARRTNAP